MPFDANSNKASKNQRQSIAYRTSISKKVENLKFIDFVNSIVKSSVCSQPVKPSITYQCSIMLGAVKLTVNVIREQTCFAYISKKYCTNAQEVGNNE